MSMAVFGSTGFAASNTEFPCRRISRSLLNSGQSDPVKDTYDEFLQPRP